MTRKWKYKKLSQTVDEEEKENYDLELFNRNNSSKSLLKVDFDTLFERPIQNGESLNSISLKYRISVTDLKRVNKLQKEIEFYALNCIKIPVKENSLLHEILVQENQVNDQNSVETAQCDQYEIPVGIISIDKICKQKETSEQARHFLENMQRDLLEIQSKTNSYKSNLDEVTKSLTGTAFISNEEKFLKCSGADWGIKWSHMLLLGCIICIGVPLLIYFYVF